MSSDPLLNKMDALLKKHRGDNEAASEPPAHPSGEDLPPLPDNAWLPVLTDVVAVEKSVEETVPTEVVPVQEPPPQPEAVVIDPEALTGQIMRELEPKLTAMLHERLANEIRISLDDTLSTLLAQMDMHIHEIVRAAINEELSKS